MENLASLRSLDATGGPSGTGRSTTSHPLERTRPSREFEDDLATARRSERREERRERQVERGERRSEAERTQARQEERQQAVRETSEAGEESTAALQDPSLPSEEDLDGQADFSADAQSSTAEVHDPDARKLAPHDQRQAPQTSTQPDPTQVRGAGAALEVLGAGDLALPSPFAAPQPLPVSAPAKPAQGVAAEIHSKASPFESAEDEDGAVSEHARTATREASRSSEPATQTTRSAESASVRPESVAGNAQRPAAPVQAAATLVAEAPGAGPSAQPEASEHAAAILRQVRLRLSPHTREATLQLEPARLGRLSIKLELRRGVTRAEVVAEQHSTFAALERHLPELQAALAAAGFEGVEVDLRHAGDGAAHSPFQPRDENAARSARRAAPRPPTELTRALTARIANSNGVDTYA